MSLILIRKIFKDIPNVNLEDNWLNNENNLQLIYDLSGVLIVFFLIYLFKKLKACIRLFGFDLFNPNIL